METVQEVETITTEKLQACIDSMQRRNGIEQYVQVTIEPTPDSHPIHKIKVAITIPAFEQGAEPIKVSNSTFVLYKTRMQTVRNTIEHAYKSAVHQLTSNLDFPIESNTSIKYHIGYTTNPVHNGQ
jgi:hypothetical protein